MPDNANMPVMPISHLSQMAQVDSYVGNSMQLREGYIRVTDSRIIHDLNLSDTSMGYHLELIRVA